MGIYAMPHRKYRNSVLLAIVLFLTATLASSVHAAPCPRINTRDNPQTITIPATVNEVGCNETGTSGTQIFNTLYHYRFNATAGDTVKITLTVDRHSTALFLFGPNYANLIGTGTIDYSGTTAITNYTNASGERNIEIVEPDSGLPTNTYTLNIEVLPKYTTACNQPCEHNEDCVTRYCYTPDPLNPNEKFCRSSGNGCAGNLDCSCNQPISGGWCDWGVCSATVCGDLGTQTRACACPTPQNGGADCTGNGTRQCRGCNCTPIDGEWQFDCGDCAGGGCTSEGEPIAGTISCTAIPDSCTATCNGSCGATTKTITCYPDCPYPWSDSTHDYRTICNNPDWYKGDPNLLGLICVIVRLLNVFVLSVGAIFVMFVFISAIKYGLAQGDPKALQGAKQTLTLAIIGMLVVIGVFTILTILRNIFGLQYQILTNPFDVLSDRLATLMKQLNIRWSP